MRGKKRERERAKKNGRIAPAVSCFSGRKLDQRERL